MGVGGKPLYLYVLYGEFIFESPGRTIGHHISSLPLAYCKVASISSVIPLNMRFQITPEISRISRLPPASRSMSDATLRILGNEIMLLVELAKRPSTSRSNLCNMSSRIISSSAALEIEYVPG